MTRIKICGITNREDARAAISYGADALGFIFVPDTPRYVGACPTALMISRQLPPLVSAIAVCRDARDIHSRWKLNYAAVQYYTNEWGIRLNPPNRLIRGFRIRSEESLAEIEHSTDTAAILLLDTYDSEKLGGSGRSFDWDLASEAKRITRKPIILAGGLTAENVTDAIAAVQPYAVDVSSGVEAEPGIKDHAKLKAFIHAVRRYDARHGQ